MAMNLDLFDAQDLTLPNVQLGSHAVVLRGFALPHVDTLLSEVKGIITQAGFRHMKTPNGYSMSVALTNCGTFGWTSDSHGYRYTRKDPDTHQPWPSLPASFISLAQQAAKTAGFDHFNPDACLINRYDPGTRMGLHQDKNEQCFDAPIVSISLGISATFLFGGLTRACPTERVTLIHGDIVVWGGPDRLRYHGIAPIKSAAHPVVGPHRLNLTFRQAG